MHPLRQDFGGAQPSGVGLARIGGSDHTIENAEDKQYPQKVLSACRSLPR